MNGIFQEIGLLIFLTKNRDENGTGKSHTYTQQTLWCSLNRQVLVYFLWDCSELNVWVVIKSVRCHGNLSEYEGRIMNIYDSSGSVVIDENFHNHIKLVSCSNPSLARLRHI